MEELRAEVRRGCEQVRQFEEKLRAAIESPVMYPSLISDVASIISTFVGVISHLNRGAARSPNPPPLRPRLQVPNPNSSPMECSPVPNPTPPHSPSPPHTTTACTTSSSSPALTPSTTPVGSPSAPPPLSGFSLDQANSDPDEQLFSSSVHDPHSWRSNRKRKCMPKKTVKLPANTTEQGTETPTDDGYTWRKYGQKDILNSKFPRSYYRCTHQKELGCQATKYVQKCEDEASMYQVTYIGEHTCQGGGATSAGVLHWTSPSSAATTLFENIQQRQQQQQPLLGTVQTSLFTSARYEDMKASRLALSPSRAMSGFNLLGPTAALSSPSQWLTPKFGGLACPIKAEPTAPPPQLATSLNQESGSARGGREMKQQELKTGSSSTPVEHSTELHEMWNLEELPVLLGHKVSATDTSVSASLEHIPKPSLSEDISSLIMLGGYDDSERSHSYEPMMFDSSHEP